MPGDSFSSKISKVRHTANADFPSFPFLDISFVSSHIVNLSLFNFLIFRWIKLRLAMVPVITIVEPLSECVLLGAGSSWATHYLFNWDPLVFFLVHLLVWFLCDFMLLCIIQVSDNLIINHLSIWRQILNFFFFLFQNGSLPFSKFEFVVGWLFREFTGLPIFLHAVSHPQIKWRSRAYRLRWGGVAEDYIKKVWYSFMRIWSQKNHSQMLPLYYLIDVMLGLWHHKCVFLRGQILYNFCSRV